MEQKPWKYLGYPAFSAFVASDDDFFFLRRFGALHARVLLSLQDQITMLEDKVKAIDQQSSSRTAIDHNNGSFREDEYEERTNVIAEIRKRIGEYST